MTTEIWKYPINPLAFLQVDLPGPVRLFHVGLDPSGTPCAWIEVTPGHLKRRAVLSVYGTGWEIPSPEEGFYRWGVGSWVQDMFVWHLIVSLEYLEREYPT